MICSRQRNVMLQEEARKQHLKIKWLNLDQAVIVSRVGKGRGWGLLRGKRKKKWGEK